MRITNIILLIMMILLISNVYALGVSPGRRTIDFKANLSEDITIKIINTEHKNFRAEIYTKGELGEYIELKRKSIEFTENENEKEIIYTVNLPEELEPGLHQGEVIIREVSPIKGGKISVGALVAVASQLHVNVLYPGRYLKADMKISANNIGEDVIFYIPAYNLGKEDLSKVKATVIVFDPEKNEVTRLYSGEKSIKSKQRTELIAKIQAFNHSMGLYGVKAVIEYDGLKTEIEKSFIIGDFWLIPLDVSVEDFTLGQINKINILVENIGNKEVKDAFSRILLNDELGNDIADIKSISTDINAKARKEVEAYWDTKDIEQGSYDGKLVLSYEGKFSEKPIVTEITENEMKVDIIGITGQVVGAPEKSIDKFSKFKVIIFILIISNIFLVVYLVFLKKKAKKKD